MGHQCSCVLAFLFQVPKHGTHAPLVPIILHFWVITTHIVSTLLVHAVVRQVHELVADVLGALIITHSCKPSQSFLIEIDDKGIIGSHEHIEAHVKLEIIYEQGVVNVTGDQDVLFQGDLVWYRILHTQLAGERSEGGCGML